MKTVKEEFSELFDYADNLLERSPYFKNNSELEKFKSEVTITSGKLNYLMTDKDAYEKMLELHNLYNSLKRNLCYVSSETCLNTDFTKEDYESIINSLKGYPLRKMIDTQITYYGNTWSFSDDKDLNSDFDYCINYENKNLNLVIESNKPEHEGSCYELILVIEGFSYNEEDCNCPIEEFFDKIIEEYQQDFSDLSQFFPTFEELYFA